MLKPMMGEKTQVSNARPGVRGLVACVAMAALVCAAGVNSVCAQAPNAAPVMLTEPPPPLLPATLGKLKRVAESDSGDGLAAVDGGDAAVLKEDGLRRFARSEYTPDGKAGAAQSSLTVYKFADVSGAISAYDYFRKPGMRAEKLGDEAVTSGDELLMRSGVNVVVGHFRVDHAGMTALTKELIDHLPKVRGPAAMAPLLPSLLPAKSLDADSVKYALGPEGYAAMGGVLPAQVVGFDKSAETVTARYKNGGVLTLMMYPTPQIAGDHLRAAEAAMQQAGSASDKGTVKLRREGPLVALTTGAWSAAEAQKLVDGVHLRSEISFDKPMPLEFHAEVTKTYSLLQSIAIFSAVGALAAVILGLFLGFGRAAIRVMMGKPAATEPEFLHIDLRGVTRRNLKGPEA